MNGRPIPTEYIRKQSPTELQLQNLPPYSFKLGLVAENDNGIISKVAEQQFNPVIINPRTGNKEIITKTEHKKGKLYVLAIGVSEYDDKKVDELDYADDDARDFAAFMETQTENDLYTDVQVNTPKLPNRVSILQGLKWLKERVKRHDTAIIFLAGHGFSEDGDYYFLPKDGESNELEITAIPYYSLKNTLTKLQGKTLLFLDSCRSGAVMGGKLKMLDTGYITNELSSQQNGIMVLTASEAQQLSYERSDLEHGIFTQALLDIFKGKTKYAVKNSTVSIMQMAYMIGNRMKELNLNTDIQQKPTVTIPHATVDYDVLVTGGE